MKERARSGEEAGAGSETLPLRQRAERNGGARQRRTMLPHGRTKRRGASWESEPCAAADAALDEDTMAHGVSSGERKKKKKKKASRCDVKCSLVVFNCREASGSFRGNFFSLS